MLMNDAIKNAVIDCVTGRDVNPGPRFGGTASYPTVGLKLYSGPQLNLVTTPAATVLSSTTVVLSPWQTGGGGISTISEPIVTTYGADGTVAYARFYSNNPSTPHSFDFECGVAGSGKECILSSLSCTAGSPPRVTSCSFKLSLDYGGMQLSDAIANAMLNVMFSSAPAPNMGGSGHVYVYTGTAPANAGSAATGTLLLDFATSTTSWTTAAAGSASLNGSISAVAGAGAGATPGYARWVKGGYVIQGTVGTSGTVFVIDSMSITSGNTYNLTSASITI